MRPHAILFVPTWLAGVCIAGGQETTGVRQAGIPWDAPITLTVNAVESPWVTGTSVVFSDMLAPTAIALPPALVLAGHAVKRHSPGAARTLAESGIRAGFSALTAHFIVQILKPVIGRERPFLRPDLGFVSRLEETGPSFPSGHAAVAAAIATSLSLSEPRAWVIVPSAFWTAGMAFSRMHLGVHYFGDVLAGMILGAASAALWHGLRERVAVATGGILPPPPPAVLAPRPVLLYAIVVPIPGLP